MTRVAAVIVNWNGGDYLLDCVESLQRPPLAQDVKTIVVDNASTDASLETVRELYPDVTIISLSSNSGFSRATNRAMPVAADYEFVLLLNPDAVITREAIIALIDEMDLYPDVGAVGPRLVGPDGVLQPVCARRDLNLSMLLFEAIGLRRAFPSSRVFGSYRMENWNHMDSRDVDALSGACMMIRLSAVPTDRLLDETIPMYFEDIDLCRRLRDNGWRVRFMGPIEVIHVGAAASSNSPQRVRLAVMEQGDAPWLFMRRYKGRVHAAVASFLIGVGAVLRIVAVSFRRVGGISKHARDDSRWLLGKYLAILRWALRPGKPHMTAL